jgi:hypothetical protein
VYEHDPRRFEIVMPRSLAEGIANGRTTLEHWAERAHREPLFRLTDHWVNMWRWSPQPRALQSLHEYAQTVERGGTIDPAEPTFRAMLNGLPRGSHLPPWAKQDLRTLFEYAKAHDLQSLEDRLFEIRFGVELDDDWSLNNDPEDIDTLWKLFRDLPPTSIEGNTRLREIALESSGGGGTYDPRAYVIRIGPGFAGTEGGVRGPHPP